MLTFFPANAEDGALIRLREADQRETVHVTGQQPGMVLPSMIRASEKAYIGMDEKSNHVLLYGVAPSPMGEDYGIVWLVASNLIQRHRLSFFKAVPDILEDLSAQHRHLHCFVDSRNELHVRWLTLIGFVRTSSHDIRGVTFHHFQYIR